MVFAGTVGIVVCSAVPYFPGDAPFSAGGCDKSVNDPDHNALVTSIDSHCRAVSLRS